MDFAGAKIGINSDKTIHCNKILEIFILKFAVDSKGNGKDISKGHFRLNLREYCIP